jgi:hypothetical protein
MVCVLLATVILCATPVPEPERVNGMVFGRAVLLEKARIGAMRRAELRTRVTEAIFQGE